MNYNSLIKLTTAIQRAQISELYGFILSVESTLLITIRWQEFSCNGLLPIAYWFTSTPAAGRRSLSVI